jgi:hypothetical protein
MGCVLGTAGAPGACIVVGAGAVGAGVPPVGPAVGGEEGFGVVDAVLGITEDCVGVAVALGIDPVV